MESDSSPRPDQSQLVQTSADEKQPQVFPKGSFAYNARDYKPQQNRGAFGVKWDAPGFESR